MHKQFVLSEHEAETRQREAAGMPPVSLAEFAEPFADRPFSMRVCRQVLELRKQAESLRAIARRGVESDDAASECDDSGLVSNIDEMTYDAGRLDASPRE